MKKFIAITLGMLILIGSIFAFKSCDPRLKPMSDEEALSGFVKANTAFLCLLKEQPTLEKDYPKTAKAELKKIYGDYGFPVDDDKKMMEILAKYEFDLSISNQIKTNAQNC